ncbi:sn-glycerol-3-phosphate import ATP-binding protein UgpC [Albirhodobacter sp. R86504]|uniref:sn-glycerol-3-phosphate import ATP-binding protein UgpC n=1 Tax=Albirhodobacter sp. R86504 TaxID=3093848 RepID=UPI003672D1EF
MAQITFNAVGKDYGNDVRAIHNADITIADGEFVVLVGPSGCGKSTLLRMVAGLEEISEGEISIGDRVVNELDPAQRDIAMVFQNYALYPHMTVRENMAYGLKNRNTPKPEIEERVAQAARMLELVPYLDRKPRALSGGQRQRVAMGRAIVRKPAAFLFDEPLSNLDAKLRVSMRAEIRALQRRLKTTALYVTHDQLEAMTLADRIVVLNAGRIEQIGTPLEVYHRPASTFVASFIGAPAMNLLDATISQGHLWVGSVDLGPLPDRLRGHASASTDGVKEGPVTLGLRAEAMMLASHPNAAHALPLDVGFVEELGSGRIVNGHVDGQPLAFSLPNRSGTQTATAQATQAAPVPDRIAITAPSEMWHLFDTLTGKRLGTDAAAPTSRVIEGMSVGA